MDINVMKITILLSIISLTAAKAYDDRANGYKYENIKAIEMLLKKLSQENNYRSHNAHQVQHHHQKLSHKKPLHPSSNFLKHNNLLEGLKIIRKQQPEIKIDQTLRYHDRICKITGRCSKSTLEELYNDEEDPLSKVQNQVRHDRSERRPLRCDSDRCEQDKNYNQFRCIGDRCAREYKQNLRCRRKKCIRPNRSGHEFITDKDTNFERYGKKIKINDDLDAIVIDVKNVNNLLEDLNDRCKDNRCHIKDLNNIIGRHTTGMVKHIYENPYGLEKYSIEPQTINFSKFRNSDVKYLYTPNVKRVLKQLKKLNMEHIYDYYRKRIVDIIKQIIISGKKKMVEKYKNLIGWEQRKLLDDLTERVQTPESEIDSKEVEAEIEKILFQKGNQQPHLIAHTFDNNVLYVPEKWLKPKLPSHKRLLSLTKLQGNKSMIHKKHSIDSNQNRITGLLVRRKGGNTQNYGVPFELQIEGLGQVNS